MLDWAGFILAIGALSLTSIFDLKERLIPDWVWFLIYPPAIILLILQVIYGGLQIINAAVSIIVAAALSSALYFTGLMGAADLLAILLIGVSVPKYPLGLPLLPDPLGVPVFAVACNSALSSIPLPIIILLRNIIDVLRGRDPLSGISVNSKFKRVLLLMTTRKVKLDDLKKGLIYFPAERILDGKRVPIIFAKAEWDFSQTLSEIEENRNLYVDGVLASPTVPMILFITSGLLLSIIGNLILGLMLYVYTPA